MGKTIQMIFSAFALVMLGIFALRLTQGEWTALNWGMTAVSAVCCLLVFVRFLYIFTYTYGLCAVLNAALIWAVRPSAATALIGGICILYGLRLFVFFWVRDHSDSYASRAAGIKREDERMPTPAKAMLWFFVSVLMTFHLMALYVIGAAAELSPGMYAGAAIMAAGVLLESIADWQKQQSKHVAPGRFVSSGLFARWRHPNYVGEMLVQIGLVVAGLSAATGVVEVVMLSLSPVYILILMVTECSRVDREQMVAYGGDEAYRYYRANSGSILPKLAG